MPKEKTKNVIRLVKEVWHKKEKTYSYFIDDSSEDKKLNTQKMCHKKKI